MGGSEMVCTFEHAVHHILGGITRRVDVHISTKLPPVQTGCCHDRIADPNLVDEVLHGGS